MWKLIIDILKFVFGVKSQTSVPENNSSATPDIIRYCSQCGAWVDGGANNLHADVDIKWTVCLKCKGGK